MASDRRISLGPNGSLTFRVVFYVSIWAVAGLLMIAFVISTLYERDAEKSLRELLRAHLYNVINSVSINDKMMLAGRPQLGDLRFNRPDTGWYWVAAPIGSFKAERLASASLGAEKLPEVPLSEVPFNSSYERYYRTKDSAGNQVMVAETEVELDDQRHVVRFRVSGNRDVITESVATFDHRLYLALSIFALGSLLLNAAAILIGLKPLDKARLALEKIRAGEAERLEGKFPSEIQPLANEVNALIDNNRRIVERARMQVGNLAHSLKTPIAVLLNESRSMSQAHSELVSKQAEAMQSQVQSYLNRARIAAQRETVLARTDARPVIERLVRVMQKLNRDIDFSLDCHDQSPVLAMESQDIEEVVGNLLENAARFAKSAIHVDMQAVRNDDADVRQAKIKISVEDDGPGLDDEQIKEALKRGKRLDESRPGSGLGLSIVSEITSEYQGQFSLRRGEKGGLLAELVLPEVVVEKSLRG